MGKLNKQSHGVGKYLKYHKEKVTGGNLPNVIQQTNGTEPTEMVDRDDTETTKECKE